LKYCRPILSCVRSLLESFTKRYK